MIVGLDDYPSMSIGLVALFVIVSFQLLTNCQNKTLHCVLQIWQLMISVFSIYLWYSYSPVALIKPLCFYTISPESVDYPSSMC